MLFGNNWLTFLFPLRAKHFCEMLRRDLSLKLAAVAVQLEILTFVRKHSSSIY